VKKSMRTCWTLAFTLFLAVIVLAGCGTPKASNPLPASLEGKSLRWVTVKRVVDGDTFETTENEKVRLIGVDTPETVKPNTPVQPYGKEASNFTKSKLTGQKVALELDVQPKDKYGRTLAYVYLQDGTFFNAELVKEGYARVLTVPPNVKYTDEFVKLQNQAREQKKGLWGLPVQ
jgi:micrococcal nuclease